MSESAPTDDPLRRRRTNQRIRIALELLIGGAAIWFVSHPRPPLPTAPPPVAGDSSHTDTLGAERDTTAVSAPFDALPNTVLPRMLTPKGRLFRSVEERARAGERIAVSVTAYCLQGLTRRDHPVRDGIIAVDRRLFPLGREVDLFFGHAKYGRFLADDTGGVIKGGRIDVWMADCRAARRFGRRRGYAQLVGRSK